MNDLKLFFVVFSYHPDGSRDWHGAAGYIFASDSYRAAEHLAKHYNSVSIKSIQEVEVKEGTVLYGERWRSENI